jgi:beta-lactamase class C
MRRTFVRVPDEEAARYAWGRRRTGERVRVAPGPFAEETYGIKTNVDDLLCLLEANLRPDALPSPLAAALRATQIGRFACGGFVQGMGWEQLPYPTTRERLLEITAAGVSDEAIPAVALPSQAPSPSTWFHKTGSTNGFGAYVVFVPGQRLGLVLLANRNVPIAARVAAAHAVVARLTR